jgi:hypothetical protein
MAGGIKRNKSSLPKGNSGVYGGTAEPKPGDEMQGGWSRQQREEMDQRFTAKAVTEALHGARFESGWTNAMPGGAVQFGQNGLNTLSVPLMVQWRKKELVTVWPKNVAKPSPVWLSR